jgi:hypothetical protein
MKRLKLALGILFFVSSFSANAATVTAFTENFNGTSLPSGWTQTTQYLLGVSNGELVINVNKTKGWQSFVFTPTNTIDFSTNPYVALKVRATQPVRLMVYLVDAANNVVKQANVRYAGGKSTNVLLDFTSAGSVNLSAVTKLYIGVNGEALTWSGKVYIDEINLAGAAVKKATLSSIEDKTYYQGTSANSFLVSDISNASSIELVGAESLIGNTIILTDLFTINGVTSGFSTITFNAKAGVSGTAVAKIITQANAGFVNDTALFNLTVEGNLPPTATVPATLDIKTGNALAFSITNISDGNSSVDQSITYTFTKISGTSIGSITSTYDKQKAAINITGQAVSAGISTYKLVIKDDGGGLDSLVKIVNVVAYANYNNPPTCEIKNENEMFINDGTIEIPIINSKDGNTGSQSLSYQVTSLNTDIISNATIGFVNGNPMEPKVVCTALVTGKATLELTISDDDFGFDNGVKSSTQKFTILVKPTPTYGFDVNISNFANDTTNQLYKLEATTSQTFTSTVFDGSPCLKIDCSNKGQWSGFWYRNPEMDISANPLLEYEIYCVDKSIETHAYFWDSKNLRNTDGAHAQRKTVSANTWTKVLMDFRGAGMMVTGSGVALNANAIDSVLFNYNGSFPFPTETFTGTIYIRSIKAGNAVTNVPSLTPIATINNPGNATYFKNEGAKKIRINNISCGAGCSEVPIVSIKTNSNAALLTGVSLSPLTAGSVDLNFTVGATTGKTNITLEVMATGSTTTTKMFSIEVLNNAISTTTFSIDTIAKKQVIAGLGAASPKIDLINQFMSTGSSVIRMFFLGDEIEPVNDNCSPFAIDQTKFLSSGLNVDYIKAAHLAGINDFVVTVLSPPSWMKQNLSETYNMSLAPTWAATTNKVDPIYYDEYVEFMVGIVQLVKVRTGVELMGICPQNEPAFCQPYGSAILDPVHMATVCGMLGKKLSTLGYKTKVIAAEQVFAQNVNAFTDAIQADTDANKYTSVIGMHYPKLDAVAYASQYNNTQEGAYPKEYWGMEMNAIGNDWTKVMAEMQIFALGLNNGVGLWAIYGWNGNALMNNSQNAVGSQLAMVYGNVPSKHFYAAKNVYKHFKPGSKIVTTALSVANANVSMVGNLNNKDSVINIVWVNIGTTNVVGTLASSILPNSGSKAYRTSEFEDYQIVTPILGDKIILPAKSVTTLAIPYNKKSILPSALPATQAANEDDYKLFPNPALNELWVSSTTDKEFNISIIDLTGRILVTKSKLNAGEAINISMLKSGLYNVLIQSDKTAVKKLFVK